MLSYVKVFADLLSVVSFVGDNFEMGILVERGRF